MFSSDGKNKGSESTANLVANAREGARELAAASGTTRSAILSHLADLLEKKTAEIVAENEKDLAQAKLSQVR